MTPNNTPQGRPVAEFGGDVHAALNAWRAKNWPKSNCTFPDCSCARQKMCGSAIPPLGPPQQTPNAEIGEGEPLACPFCGTPNPVKMPNDRATDGGSMGIPDGVSLSFYLHCDGCGADGPCTEDEPTSITWWNARARPIPAAPAAVVDEGMREPTQAMLDAAVRAWDEDIDDIHVQATAIWKAMRAAAPRSAIAPDDARDAARLAKLKRFLSSGHIPGAGHGTRIKLIEICPMFGDEAEFPIDELLKAVDAALHPTAPAGEGGEK